MMKNGYGTFLIENCKDRFRNLVTADTGEQAIEKIQESNFDLVLLDLKMPGMSGLQVFEEIKNLSPNSLVIIQTGFGTKDHVKKAIHLGAFDYIEKPYERTLLGKTLDRAIQKIHLEKMNNEILEYLLLTLTEIDLKEYQEMEKEKKSLLLEQVLGVLRVQRLNLLKKKKNDKSA
ncbi:MAG: response regulator [Oligoflexales bacterium]